MTLVTGALTGFGAFKPPAAGGGNPNKKTALFYQYADLNGADADSDFVPLGCASSPITTGFSITEALAQAPVAVAGTLSNLRVTYDTGGTGRAGTIRLGGTNTSIAASLTATDTTIQSAVDDSNTASVSAADKLSLGITGGAVHLRSVRSVFLASSNTVFALCAHHASGALASSTTAYLPPFGTPLNLTEGNAQLLVRAAGTIERHFIYVTSNTRDNDTTLEVGVNGSYSGTVTIGATLTGLFEYTSSAISVSAGDLINFRTIEVTTATGQINASLLGLTFVSTNGKQDIFSAPDSARTASATLHYWPVAGYGNWETNTTEADSQLSFGFAGTLSNLRIKCAANTYTGNATLTVYKNGVATALTVTITAGTTTLIEDTVNSFTFNATDLIGLVIEGGTSGSITARSIGLTVAAD